VSGQQHAPAILYPGKDPVPTEQEAGWAPGLVWTGAENLGSTGKQSSLSLSFLMQNIKLHSKRANYKLPSLSPYRTKFINNAERWKRNRISDLLQMVPLYVNAYNTYGTV
jgi:hypothetical protein